MGRGRKLLNLVLTNDQGKILPNENDDDSIDCENNQSRGASVSEDQMARMQMLEGKPNENDDDDQNNWDRESPVTEEQMAIANSLQKIIDVECLESSEEQVISPPQLPVREPLSVPSVSGVQEIFSPQYICPPSLEDFCNNVLNSRPELENLDSETLSPPPDMSEQIPTPANNFEENSHGLQVIRNVATTRSESSTPTLSEESCDDSIADPDYNINDNPNLPMDRERTDSPSLLMDAERNDLPDTRTELLDISEPEVTKRKRNKRKCEESWKQNIRKMRRNLGMAYETKSGLKPARQPKFNSCGCKKQCDLLFEDTDDAKQKLFDVYWNLGNIERQRDYLVRCVKSETAKRPRVNESRRKFTLKYTFTFHESEYVVCKKFFLNTLCLTDKVVRNALSKKRRSVGGLPSPDKRGKHTPGIALSEERVTHAKAHIDSFPAVPSHWCRKDTKKIYLEPILNREKMYNLYKQQCESDGLQPVSRSTYKELLIKKNIAFHSPRKDQCWCQTFDLLSDEEKIAKKDEFDQHRQRKDLAKKEKDNDTERAKQDTSITCVNFDLEAVLYCPLVLAKPVFYKRKLATYNFTVFDPKRKQGNCYLWPEFEGNRGANEIASCLWSYIKSEVPRTTKQLIMYSDCCPGQNRNSIMAYMLFFAINAEDCCLDLIDYKFLEPGHTYMECDSMHAAIERASEYAKIYVPNDWENVIKLAKKTKPYFVTQLKHNNFIDFKKMRDTLPSNLKSVDGQVLTWNRVKWLRFEKENPNTILFKLDFNDAQFQEVRLPMRTRASIDVPSCYTEQLPVSNAKLKDLQEMLRTGLIPATYSEFYRNLPSSNRVNDEDIALAASRASYITRRSRR